MGNEADAEALDRVGTVLNGKWTLERLLGVGGMGAVYAGVHRNGAHGAIKVLHRDLAHHKAVRERFQREGYAANKVDHPGVVKVLDDDIVSGGPDAGSAYLVMELLEGVSLQDRLEQGQSFGEHELLEIFDSVLDVLRAAHEASVVHRDLKPENLFFARMEDGTTRLKVLDFGLARLLQGQTITSYGLALGTPSFMSPEQAAGRIDEIDGRTDLFSLAATGFRLRTGRRIHEADDAVELVKKMAQLPAPRIRTVAPDASEPYARVIDKALEFKREDRHESAAAMQADVRRALAELDRAPRGTAEARPVPALPAVPPPLPAAAERTVEISERDLERPPPYGIDESVRIPKRRSILPWVALLLCSGVGAKLWLDARAATNESTTGAAPSASALDWNGLSEAGLGGRGDAGAARPHGSPTHHPSTTKPAPSSLR